MERKTRLRNFTTLQKARNGRRMDVEQSGGIRCCLLSGIDQMYDLLLLVGLEFWAAASDPTLFTCCIQASLSAFTQHRAFELCKGSYIVPDAVSRGELRPLRDPNDADA